MDSLEILIRALVRFSGSAVILGGELQGEARFDTIEQASGFASAIEEGFDVDDPMPFQCPTHDDESGWEVLYHV